MTPLESKTIRDGRGINTYERGFLYATLLLITSNISPDNTKVGAANPYYDAIKLSFERGESNIITNDRGDQKVEVIDPAVVVEAYLPYDQGLSLRTGGNFFEQIKNFGNKDPNPISVTVQPDPTPEDVIKEDPTWVDSLEKYLAWTASAMDFSGLYFGNIYPRQIAINFVENNSKLPFIKINAVLPYNYETFLRNRNLLSALRSNPIK